MQKETLQICAVILPAKQAKTKLHCRCSRMTVKRDDDENEGGRKRVMGGDGEVADKM